MPKRRGIMIQKNVKPKPKIKVEKQNLSNILSQGASKNKQEMEALLSTHGGGFKTDFGLRGTIDFGEETKNDGWNRLFGYINGTIKDERIDDAIEQRRLFKDQKHFQKKKLEPINPKVPTSPESLTDITKVFLDKMKQQKKTKKTKKIKQIKLVKNFKQKKKVTRNRPDFVTPPPKLNNTLNIQYCEEPETNYKHKRNLNNLKESISKLSTDFNNDRMMFQSMIKSTTKKRNPQFFNQQYFKSIDAAANNEEMLPSIHASSNVKRFPVKSPVMESIRASRNLGAKNFMSAQRVDSPSKYSSDDDVSQVSKVSNMRKSYIRARKNKLNTSTLNKGTFFVHKREKSAKPAEKHQSVIRASTFLNNSVIFSSINKNPKKKEPEARKSKNVFSDRRTSKSFVEKVGFNNHLAVNNLQQSYIMNPCIESKEGSEDFGDFGDVMEHDITTSQNFSGRQKRGVSLKSDGKAYSKQNTDENKRRCTTKAGTNDGGPGERGVLTTSPEDHLSDNYCISPDDSNS